MVSFIVLNSQRNAAVEKIQKKNKKKQSQGELRFSTLKRSLWPSTATSCSPISTFFESHNYYRKY